MFTLYIYIYIYIAFIWQIKFTSRYSVKLTNSSPSFLPPFSAFLYHYIFFSASHIPNLSKPTGHVTHQQFNIQQLYALSTQYLCVLYLSENKERLVPLTA